MNRLLTAGLLAVTCAVVSAAPAAAQTATNTQGISIGGSVALASMWDDETHLGRGPAIAGEVSAPLGEYLRVAIEGGWFGHDRDAGYLRAEGDMATLMGRGTVLLGPSTWRLRPIVGMGVGVARSTGTLTTSSPGNGFGNIPTEPDQVRDWTLTRPVWDASLGVRVAAGPRLFLRPELRAGMTSGGSSNAIEPPLLRLQAGIALEWVVR